VLVLVAVVVRWGCALPSTAPIDPVVDAVAIHLPPHCEAASMTKTVEVRRIDRRALTERGADLSGRRVAENAIHMSNYHPGE
jgi:hypothetical protein